MVKSLFFNVTNFKSYNRLGQNRCGRTFRRIEESNGLRIGAQFITFGDIARNTDCRATDLIPKAIVFQQKLPDQISYKYIIWPGLLPVAIL